MRLSYLLFNALTFVAAGLLAVVVASASVKLIENYSEIAVRDALDMESLTWAEVEADGLKVTIAGTAPDEAIRFRALSVAGSVVDAARLNDEMDVTSTALLIAPRFSAEVLRNATGISIIGLIPESTDRDAVIAAFQKMSPDPVADLLETADYSAPQGWEDALAFAINAIADLPRAKVSVSAGRVAITAISDSAQEKAKLEAKLSRASPPGLRLTLNIAAPRPVITPFTLRFVIDDNGARFDACSADTVESETRILAAARAAGMTETGRCVVGMGVPTPTWGAAAETAIAALARLGQGTITFSNADVTLIAAEGTSQSDFDRVVGELQADLPDVFALFPVLPDTPDPNQGPPEFLATLSPEGQVQLRGRLPDETLRDMADSFAKARFGTSAVYTAARIAPDLPADWPTRVLTALEALAALNNGIVRVTPNTVAVSGNTGDPEAGAEIARILAAKLGEEADFDIDVTYQEQLDPQLDLPSPEECEVRISQILINGKISFEPGSATIDTASLPSMDAIAELLKTCGDVKLEIQGHTDSQGREEMNLALSQARAQSVLNELQARRVLTSSFEAKGYGELQPIADNGSEEGRETNRRIEFHLIKPEPSIPQGNSALESLSESNDTDEVEQQTEGTPDDQN